jgi:hypothetical protein
VLMIRWLGGECVMVTEEAQNIVVMPVISLVLKMFFFFSFSWNAGWAWLSGGGK